MNFVRWQCLTSDPAVPQLYPVETDTPILASKIPIIDSVIDASIDVSMLIDSDQESEYVVPIFYKTDIYVKFSLKYRSLNFILISYLYIFTCYFTG